MARRGRWAIIPSALAFVLCVVGMVNSFENKNRVLGAVMGLCVGVNITCIVLIWRNTRD